MAETRNVLEVNLQTKSPWPQNFCIVIEALLKYTPVWVSEGISVFLCRHISQQILDFYPAFMYFFLTRTIWAVFEVSIKDWLNEASSTAPSPQHTDKGLMMMLARLLCVLCFSQHGSKCVWSHRHYEKNHNVMSLSLSLSGSPTLCVKVVYISLDLRKLWIDNIKKDLLLWCDSLNWKLTSFRRCPRLGLCKFNLNWPITVILVLICGDSIGFGEMLLMKNTFLTISKSTALANARYDWSWHHLEKGMGC